jgi:hypothetical protein
LTCASHFVLFRRHCPIHPRFAVSSRFRRRHTYPWPPTLHCPVLHSHCVLEVHEHLPSGAAAGASGWTYAAMKAIFLRNSAYSGRASQLLATFCNLMFSGQLLSQVWLRTRSVFVPKQNGRPRPLGIGDSRYRFVGRVALSKFGDRIGHALLPVQLGIGVKNGAEIGGCMAQLVFDFGGNLVFLSLDTENGFNTLPACSACIGDPV